MSLGIVASARHAAGGGGITDPLDIANCSLWLDAADSGTITDAGAGAVSQWNDKSANAYHVSQASSHNMPTTGTRTQNGLNVLDFDGGADFLMRSSAPINSATDGTFTVFAVALNDTLSTTDNLVDGDHGSTPNRVAAYLRTVGTDAGMAVWNTGNQHTPEAAGATLSTGTAYLFRSIASFDGTNSSVEVFVDGVGDGPTARSGQINYQAGIGLGIGRRPISNGQNWDGWIAEVVSYSRTLTPTEIGQVETYLTAKWGI